MKFYTPFSYPLRVKTGLYEVNTSYSSNAHAFRAYGTAWQRGTHNRDKARLSGPGRRSAPCPGLRHPTGAKTRINSPQAATPPAGYTGRVCARA